MSMFSRTKTTTPTDFEQATQAVADIAGDYTLDVSHTRLGFSARHAMVTTVRGQFQDYTGHAHIDLVWLWPERVHPRRKKVPNPDVVVVRVADLEEKRALLASDPRTFFTTDHYDGYKAVLVRLSAADPAVLAEVLTDAWRTQAPRDLTGG